LADESFARYNSKLGRGGLVDVEFAVQFLQLVHGSSHPSVRTSSTTAALAEAAPHRAARRASRRSARAGPIVPPRVESRLRIVRDRAISHLPTSGRELVLLAAGWATAGPRWRRAARRLRRETQSVRAAFLRVLEPA